MRYSIQEIADDKTRDGIHYRITDNNGDNRIATCYLKENAELVCEALNTLYNKKKTKPKIEVPADKIIQFNELFPKIKLPSGKYARCNERELASAFTWFIKNHPELYDWEVILKATEIYVQEYERKNYEYMRRSMYFVKKQLNDKSVISELAEYCSRVKSGEFEEENNNPHFTEKVV